MCLAIPGQIVELESNGSSATVEFGGVRRVVSLLLLENSSLGEWVLVHGGFAIGVVNEDEVRRTLSSLAELTSCEGGKVMDPQGELPQVILREESRKSRDE